MRSCEILCVLIISVASKLTNLKVQVTGVAGKDEFRLYYVIMLSFMSVLACEKEDTLAQLILVSSMNDTSVELTATSKSAAENC
ncbi:hypothetical protein T01_7136 [Trichinella spiralis]|uniref:Uncharacterized protein n=1 Tax=Trichinella spiralis TaxID=6334 RepID=A0A0V1BN68_TRISP|nr:hypothetical protein T01_7136 [Trichinella spiralis]